MRYLILCLLLVYTPRALANHIQLERTTRLASTTATTAYNRVLLSSDGRYGFLTATFGDSLQILETASGRIISTLDTGSNATSLALHERKDLRLLAVVNLNDVAKGESARVSIIDVSLADRPVLLSSFPLADISPFINPVFTPEGDRLLIADSRRVYLLDARTAESLHSIDSGGVVDSLSISRLEDELVLTAVKSGDGSVTVYEVTTDGLKQWSRFVVPSAIVAANNVALDGSPFGYIAGFAEHQVYGFDLRSGTLVSSIETGDAPASIAAFRSGSKTRLAVVNTGQNSGFLSDSISVLEAETATGYLRHRSVFVAGTDLSPESNVAFLDRNHCLAGSAAGSLLVFKASSGEMVSEKRMAGDTSRFALSRGLALTLVSTAQEDSLTLFRLTPPEPLPKITSIKVSRVRKGLRLEVLAEGLQAGARLTVRSQEVPHTQDRHNPNRIVGLVAWSFVGRTCAFDVGVILPDGKLVTATRQIKRRRVRCR